MMDTDKNEERDELRGRFTRFMEICVRNARFQNTSSDEKKNTDDAIR